MSFTDPEDPDYTRDLETEEREGAGYELLRGNPLLYSVEYILALQIDDIVTSYTWFASNVTKSAKVWRKAL